MFSLCVALDYKKTKKKKKKNKKKNCNSSNKPQKATVTYTKILDMVKTSGKAGGK
jgi:hypothetical protein